MKAELHLGVVLVIGLLATAVGAAEPSSGEARSAAQDLATRLSVSPPVSSWVDDASKQPSFQADVNRMAYLASHLAAEIANGSGRDRTLGLYKELRSVGVRILRRIRATGEQLPSTDVATYEQLMAKLEAYYGPAADADADAELP